MPYSERGYVTSPHHPIAQLFSHVSAPKNKALKKEKWTEAANTTYSFCSDPVAVIDTDGFSYDKILLLPGKIQVKKLTLESSQQFRGRKVKGEFAAYDFLLIGLSLLSIIIYLSFLLVKKKGTLSIADRMMVVLLSCLFAALSCFAFITTPAGKDLIGCRVLAALTQFFFLASLTWSNSMAISLVKATYSMSLYKISQSAIVIYTLYSFGIPFLCTLITFLLSVIDVKSFTEGVYETKSICFLREAVVVYSLFLVPAYIIIVANIIAALIVMTRVLRSKQVGFSRDVNRTKKQLITCFKISIFLGVGWILIFIATFVHELWQAMQVFVELQGVFITAFNILDLKCINSIKKRTMASIFPMLKKPSFPMSSGASQENIAISADQSNRRASTETV
ncbi:probable G-protein coupled receptor Mth-like 1 [Watersipora subatra]|uniref:probable G-protein coupled receptor Mth-like 1 n=1 Tax=Watersipora subatra TaxID=2589382 RepID=UPI00355B9E34